MTYIAATSSLWRRSVLQAFPSSLLCTDRSQASTNRICRQLTSIHHLSRPTRWRTERQLRLSQSKSFNYAESDIHFKPACWKGWSLCAARGDNRRGKKAGRQLFSLIAPIIWLHQGKKTKQKLNLKGKRLYTIADNVTIIDKFSYILSACINTISYNGSNISNTDISVTQNPLMQYNARRYERKTNVFKWK